MAGDTTVTVKAWRIGEDAEVLAAELRERGVPLDTLLDAVGLMLAVDPNAGAIIAGWMNKMMTFGV